MSKATKILSDEEKQAELQLADQIRKIPLMGTKMIMKQLECKETPEAYCKACEAELEVREAAYKGEEQKGADPVTPELPPEDPNGEKGSGQDQSPEGGQLDS